VLSELEDDELEDDTLPSDSEELELKSNALNHE